MRKAIAAHMTRFLEVPVAYITIEVDMTRVVRTRSALSGEYKAREGIGLSYVAYVTKACVEALRKHHDLNAHWTPEGHWRRKDINIGIAVAVPDGLVVPVIKKAQDLSLHGLNQAINDLAARARSKRLRPEDLEGGTFTVDNTGWTGSILTLPIINVPEVAIITMEKIVKRPVVLEDQGDAIAIRSMMNMCIAIDHRATDGAQAGEFLADVRTWLEVGRRAHPDLVAPMARELPIFQPAAQASGHGHDLGSRPLTIAMGGSVDTSGLRGPERPPSSGLDPGPASERRQLRGAQEARAHPGRSTRSARRRAAPTSGSAGSSARPRS